MASAVPKVRWRVSAIEKEKPAWCIPLPSGSSIGDLKRAVEIRENMLRQDAGKPGIIVGIQLRLDGDLCSVHPADLLLDLVPEYSKDTMFVATCKGDTDAVAATLPPSRAAAAAAKAEAAAAEASAGTGAGPRPTPAVSGKPTAYLPTQFVSSSRPATSCVKARAAGAAESGRPTVAPRTSNQMKLSNGLALPSAVDEEAVPATPASTPASAGQAPMGERAVALLGPTPGVPPSHNHHQHGHQPSVNSTERRQEPATADCGGAKVTAAPAAPAGAGAQAATSPAFHLPAAPFRPSERSTPLVSSSKPSASSGASATAPPAPFSSSSPAAAATTISGGNHIESMRNGSDDEDDVVCLGTSCGPSSSAAASSPRPKKKARAPRQKARRQTGNDLKLLPRSAFKSQRQAAATIVLAAAMLRGGTPTQQSQAEAFIASELAKHDKDLTGQLVARLKDTAKVDEDGIWVNFQKVNGLLGTYTSDQGFICLTLYISNNTYSASCIDAKNPLQFLTSAYYSVAGKEGSAWQLERWQADGEKFFKWRDDVVCHEDSEGSGGAGGATSSRLSRMKTWVPRSPPQLLPRSSLSNRTKAAETIVLAAVMLCAGTSNQRTEAGAFVEAELAKHDKEVSARLIEKMKCMVKMDEDGVWVGWIDPVDLCRTQQNPLGFYGVTRYLLGDHSTNMFERSAVRSSFVLFQDNAIGQSGGPFEMWEKDGQRLFKWLGVQM